MAELRNIEVLQFSEPRAHSLAELGISTGKEHCESASIIFIPGNLNFPASQIPIYEFRQRQLLVLGVYESSLSNYKACT